jgi:hypothetical protein
MARAEFRPCDREVERADDADHAQRVPGFHHAMARALEAW